jgi:polyisoprenoid-binding protein YceI
MNRTVVIIAVVALVVVAAGLAYAVFRTPEEASAPIEAVPLAVDTVPPPAPTVERTATSLPAAPATVAPEATAPSAPEPSATPALEPTATVEAEPTEASAAAGPILFEIVPDESEARFIIDEVLRGAPTRVVGATNQVAGQISVDPADPASAQVGRILVNARTLATDNEFRNRAIKNRILQTDAYEFVSFQPTQLAGLPASVAVGESFSFQITGDLTIRNTTKPVTFAVTLTPVDEARLEGLATLTIPYRDFNLAIPDAPAVDTVADDVTLELEFVAAATQ